MRTEFHILKKQNNLHNLRKLKTDFPIFLKQNNRGKPLVYLDSAASAQKPRQVIEALLHFYSQDYANIHRGIYELSERASAQYENTRKDVQQFIHAGDSTEIVFVRSTTEGINLVAQSYGRTFFKPGDEIILTHISEAIEIYQPLQGAEANNLILARMHQQLGEIYAQAEKNYIFALKNYQAAYQLFMHSNIEPNADELILLNLDICNTHIEQGNSLFNDKHFLAACETFQQGINHLVNNYRRNTYTQQAIDLYDACLDASKAYADTFAKEIKSCHLEESALFSLINITDKTLQSAETLTTKIRQEDPSFEHRDTDETQLKIILLSLLSQRIKNAISNLTLDTAHNDFKQMGRINFELCTYKIEYLQSIRASLGHAFHTLAKKYFAENKFSQTVGACESALLYLNSIHLMKDTDTIQAILELKDSAADKTPIVSDDLNFKKG